MDSLEASLYNLYTWNMMVCAKQGVNRVECEKRIEATIERIQWITKEVCGTDEACQKIWLEWHIDKEEIAKLRAKLLLTYT